MYRYVCVLVKSKKCRNFDGLRLEKRYEKKKKKKKKQKKQNKIKKTKSKTKKKKFMGRMH
jgi:hypothetical protein